MLCNSPGALQIGGDGPGLMMGGTGGAGGGMGKSIAVSFRENVDWGYSHLFSSTCTCIYKHVTTSFNQLPCTDFNHYQAEGWAGALLQDVVDLWAHRAIPTKDLRLVKTILMPSTPPTSEKWKM